MTKTGLWHFLTWGTKNAHCTFGQCFLRSGTKCALHVWTMFSQIWSHKESFWRIVWGTSSRKSPEYYYCGSQPKWLLTDHKYNYASANIKVIITIFEKSSDSTLDGEAKLSMLKCVVTILILTLGLYSQRQQVRQHIQHTISRVCQRPMQKGSKVFSQEFKQLTLHDGMIAYSLQWLLLWLTACSNCASTVCGKLHILWPYWSCPQ